ncbi:DUF3667 domain-containing protein [Flavitalea sp.]|nr:DUF3667 domain-containing protein [Flavitalea sp.]
MQTCQNCGDTRQEKFCPNCGEKTFHAKALSIKHLAGETFESLSHFDNKFFKSVATLLIRPGVLSYQYCNGVTVRFMKPFSLFLVANLIFFLLPVQNPFSLPLYNYVTYEPFTTMGNTREAVRAKLRETGLTEKELTSTFNERIRSNSKIFIALFIPFFAGIFALIFFSSRKRFGEHLVFATHFMTFLICLMVLLTLFFMLTPISFNAGSGDTVVTIILSLILCTYLSIGVHRFYVRSWWKAVLASLVIVVSLIISEQAFRMFLFYQVLSGIG